MAECKMKAISRISALLILLISIMVACTPRAVNKPPDEVTVQLKWLHQAQFAGFYLAQEKGYYAQENIYARFSSGGPGVNILERVTSGNAHFGLTAPEDIILNHRQSMPVVAIATIYRRNPLVFVTLADSGIEQPTDFIGRTASLAGSESEVQFRAMMKKLGLNISLIKLVPYDLDRSAFYARNVDITYAYSTVGVIYMQAQGYELHMIWPDDYGIHMFTDTLVTTEKMITENTDLVIRFLRATLRGWNQAIQDPETAAAMTIKYAITSNVQLQTEIIKASMPFIHTGEDHIGWMKAEAWEEIHQTLLEQQILAQPVEIQKVYTTEFLEGIYKGNEHEINR